MIQYLFLLHLCINSHPIYKYLQNYYTNNIGIYSLPHQLYQNIVDLDIIHFQYNSQLKYNKLKVNHSFTYNLRVSNMFCTHFGYSSNKVYHIHLQILNSILNLFNYNLIPLIVLYIYYLPQHINLKDSLNFQPYNNLDLHINHLQSKHISYQTNLKFYNIFPQDRYTNKFFQNINQLFHHNHI